MAKEAYYFSHDCNAQSDPKIMLLIDKYGMEGYGTYWALIEKLREDAEYKLPISILPSLSKRLKIKTDKLNCIVNDFLLFKHDENFFWSESLYRRMYIKKERAKLGAKARWENAAAMQLHKEALQNDAIKVKEKKVKEKKEEKKREQAPFVAPSLSEFTDYFKENGYKTDVAERAWNSYNVANWFDTKGNEIRSWKQKCQQVWFKDEHKSYKENHNTPRTISSFI